MPTACAGCGQSFEIQYVGPTVLGVLRTYTFTCPTAGCERQHEKLLAGDIVRVVGA
jgi:hypothetical protein